MVEAYNTLSASHNLPNMHAIQGDLLSASPSSPFQDSKFFNFDIIVMSMALHHVSDTQIMVNKLKERLRQGGVLVIVDWLTMGLGGDGHAHVHGHGHEHDDEVKGEGGVTAATHTVAHWGFSVEEMTTLFEGAGMVDVGFMEGIEKSNVPAEMKGEQQMFISKARKVRNN
jgi:SAM-dependent methyltransferase